MSIHPKLSELGLFDARVPRYTSYPTAPQFSAAITSEHVRGWLSEIQPGSTVSLYLHIPFCRHLCWFCACRTQGTSTLSPVAAYVETLKKEISLVAESLPSGVRIEHLHWGGGTPTLLDARLIESLASAIFRRIPLADKAQFSVEIDPNEIDDARLDALVGAGMNRASIGVQDFDPEIQKTIGREQSLDVTRAAIDGLRKRGITSLNMDILYGLPHQTPEKVSRSVSQVVALSPDRVALFGYAHVPWMAKRQALIPTEALPSPPSRFALFEKAREMFLENGYVEIGIDHFARPQDGLAKALSAGTLRRNFQGYTEDTSTTLIGLGASAISRYPQGYAQNAPATSAYQERVRAGLLATSRGHAFQGDDLLRARMIELLLCEFEIRFERLAEEIQADKAAMIAMTKPLGPAFSGLVKVDETGVFITPQARPLARIIARHLDAYQMEPTGHSYAV